ncbi:MAG: PAM68 family protein [Desertifilum sp.]|nr:PAM68 family protein [Desertifilum sp.]
MSPQKDRETSQSDRLPFEPNRRKKPAKTSSDASKNSAPEAAATRNQPKSRSSASGSDRSSSRTIPEVVSKRMVRRMATLSGVPFGLAISTFFASYWIVTQTEFPLPHVAVVLVSMGFFGLSVLGLSYGVLSASWDEQAPGSLLGWQEFTTNFGRMTAAWRSSKQNE